MFGPINSLEKLGAGDAFCIVHGQVELHSDSYKNNKWKKETKKNRKTEIYRVWSFFALFQPHHKAVSELNKWTPMPSDHLSRNLVDISFIVQIMYFNFLQCDNCK